MCGITGVVARAGNEASDPTTLSRMCDTLVHRGPDSQGTFLEDGVALGARRLAIIDLATGDQPLRNEDGSVVLVYNGEVYNHRALREGLVARGHRFASRSDGEVLVHLWEEQGGDFLESVNGMFALALFDRRRRLVVLARDRIGIKPLYVADSGSHVVFGSEPKAILASGLVAPTLDYDALRQFLTWEYVPAPATLFREIRKLEPGRIMEVPLDSTDTRTRSYWDVPLPGASSDHSPASDARFVEAVAEKVGEAVRGQLGSDVPLGAFLSGGVDSSLVVAEMGTVSTFSIGFDDPSYNELHWSRRVAEHLGVPHTTEVIEPRVVDLFDRLMPFLDDPIGDFSIFPTYLVSRLARQDVTVVLSGDGGDELFGGYETYVAELMASRYGAIPGVLRQGLLEPAIERLRPRPQKKGLVNKARRFVEGYRLDPRLHHARWRMFLDPGGADALFTPEALREMRVDPRRHVLDLFDGAGHRSLVDRMLYVDLKSYLPDNCLAKVDRMSMACSLETRVPLLDHELVELAFRMPAHLKLQGRRTKVGLKRVAERRLPRECVHRPKEGFSIPIKHWLATSLQPLMIDLLSPARLRAQGIFEADVVERLMREHLEGHENHSHLLWSLMVFQDWRDRWLS
ncbi:MAG: asparagine synthase (glutamine-hydrolyzing) [Gemmatimonadota bacterium]